MDSRSLARRLCLLAVPGVMLAQTWVSSYDGPAGSQDRASGVVVDSAGNVYVTGQSTGATTGRDFLTIKYNPAGDTVWTRRYSSNGAAYDSAAGIACDPRGFVVVTGAATATSLDILSIKYNSLTAETLWTRRYNGPGNGADRPAAVTLDQSGNIYVCGSVRVGGHDEAAVIKYNQAGTQQWVARLGTTLHDSSSAARALAVDQSGFTYVCGRIRDSLGTDDCLVARLTATGGVSWSRRYSGTGRGRDSAVALAVDNSGSVYVTGASQGDTTGMDMVTLKYSSSGTLLWVARADNRPGLDDGGTALALDSAGGVWVAGGGSGPNGIDFVLVHYSASGAVLSRSSYDGSTHGDDQPHVLALDRTGAVYLTGVSAESSPDILTAKFDPTGRLVWASRYDGPARGEDQGMALAVPEPGRVLVAGFSQAAGANDDFLTLQYLEHDVGISRLIRPDTTMPPQPFLPRVRLRNYGTLRDTVTVNLEITSAGVAVFADAATVPGIAPNANYDLNFRTFAGEPGEYEVRVWHTLGSDQNRANDTLVGRFVCAWSSAPVWNQAADVPAGPSGKNVKDGAALCFGPSGPTGPMLFAVKGYNTSEFCGYNVEGDSWLVLDSLPCAPGRAKRVKKGAALACDPYDTMVYALKGNNTTEFWKYDVRGDSWVAMRDIPLGTSNKKVKGGSGLAFCRRSTGSFVYAAKGGKRNEFWAYDVTRDTWLGMADVPPGDRLKGMADGSCLVTAGNRLYALKAAVNEFYRYDVTANAWSAVRDLPVAGATKSRRTARYGTALCSDGSLVMALKGGSCEFWAYHIEADTWFELESMPRMPSGRPVRNGGALAWGNGRAWALKGNKTLEFWSYDPGRALQRVVPNRTRAICSAEPNPGRRGLGFRVFPNPLGSSHLDVRFDLPVTMTPVLCLRDVSGRVMVSQEVHGCRAGALQLDLAGLPSGVYLAALEVGDVTVVEKLVIRR